VNTYTWDRAHRLLSEGGSSYKYDGLGRRVQQTIGANITDYLLDVQPGLWKVLAATTGANTTRYVHGLTGIHQQRNPDNTWRWFGQDGLGSVRMVMDSSAPQESRIYSPYGEVVQTSGTNQSAFGYTGEPTDANGLVYLRARYMNPAFGQFVSLDPLETPNRYAYVGGNPIMWNDPSGLMIPAEFDGGRDWPPTPPAPTPTPQPNPQPSSRNCSCYTGEMWTACAIYKQVPECSSGSRSPAPTPTPPTPPPPPSTPQSPTSTATQPSKDCSCYKGNYGMYWACYQNQVPGCQRSSRIYVSSRRPARRLVASDTNPDPCACRDANLILPCRMGWIRFTQPCSTPTPTPDRQYPCRSAALSPIFGSGSGRTPKQDGFFYNQIVQGTLHGAVDIVPISVYPAASNPNWASNNPVDVHAVVSGTLKISSPQFAQLQPSDPIFKNLEFVYAHVKFYTKVGGPDYVASVSDRSPITLQVKGGDTIGTVAPQSESDSKIETSDFSHVHFGLRDLRPLYWTRTYDPSECLINYQP